MTEPLIHYYDDCGQETGDGDVYAAEPWGITCPACRQLVREGDPDVTISLVIDEADNLIAYRGQHPDLDRETLAVVDDLIENGRAQVWPRGSAGAGPGEPDRGDGHLS